MLLHTAAHVLPLPALARITGRPYWALRYFGGRVVEEPHCDWLDAPRKGRQQLRLYCPNGEVAELGAGSASGGSGDGTGRFFQLKQAVNSLSRGRHTLCQMIGLVVDTNGRCLCAVWEYGHADGVGGADGGQPGRLVHFEDNAYAMRYGNIGALCADHLGLDTK